MATRINKYLETVSTFDNLEIDLIQSSGNPLRKSTGDLTDLVESIRVHGLLQPILVRPLGDGFEVVAGNRRFEACRRLKHRRVKSIVMDLDDKSAYEIAITENVQRRTLDPLEEGLAFKRYCDEFGWGSETELAKKIGKSQEFVSHRLKLLSLPEEVKSALRERRIALTSAEELMWMKDDEAKKKIANFISGEKIGMYEVRNLVRRLESTTTNASSTTLGSKGEEGNDGFPFASYHSAESGEEQEFSKVTTELILVLRIALIRIDDLIGKTEDSKVKQLCIAKRVELHRVIDDLIFARKRGIVSLPELEQVRSHRN